jgi:hypothetical protein
MRGCSTWISVFTSFLTKWDFRNPAISPDLNLVVKACWRRVLIRYKQPQSTSGVSKTNLETDLLVACTLSGEAGRCRGLSLEIDVSREPCLALDEYHVIFDWAARTARTARSARSARSAFVRYTILKGLAPDKLSSVTKYISIHRSAKVCGCASCGLGVSRPGYQFPVVISSSTT